MMLGAQLSAWAKTNRAFLVAQDGVYKDVVDINTSEVVPVPHSSTFCANENTMDTGRKVLVVAVLVCLS